MFSLKELFSYIFKGFLIGFGMLIPGVSGGTVAVFLNVFEDILESVGGFFEHISKSVKTLLPIASGALIGIYLCSSPIEQFCMEFPALSKYIFCFIAIVSCFFFAKQKIGLKLNTKHIVCVISGCIIALLISICLNLFNVNLSNGGFFILLLIGMLLSLALILPAISFSYMLLFFGIYDKVLNAIGNMNFGYLLPLAFGVAFGSYIFSKILLRLLERYSKETYCFVFGFVLLSIADILY